MILSSKSSVHEDFYDVSTLSHRSEPEFPFGLLEERVGLPTSSFSPL
jgi:hypothetical protein